MPSKKEISPLIPGFDDSSDDDDSDTDAILASLLSKLDDLEHQQHETVSAITEQLQKQRREVDALCKLVHEVKAVIHQKRFARQKAKIKKLKALRNAATPLRLVSVEPTPHDVKVKRKGSESVGLKEAPLFPSRATLSATVAGDVSPHQYEDTVMEMGDDDDNDPQVPPAPVSPTEATGVEKVTKPLSGGHAANIAEDEVAPKEKQRPVQKMVPTRGNFRGRVSGRGAFGKAQRGNTLGSTSSRSNSKESEATTPLSTNHTKGLGTGRRSKPLARGAAPGRSTTSSGGSDGGETVPKLAVPPPVPESARSNGFVAVNAPQPPDGPGPSNWMGDDDDDDESISLSLLPAGAGKARPYGEESPKALPPPRTQAFSPEPAPRKNFKRLAFTHPAEPVLFSARELRAIFGGGNPGSIIVNITQEGQANQVVKTASYICLSSDAHFDPPGTMGDNAEMLDIYGQEDPLDSNTLYPVFKKINKMYMYCGDYTQGAREMVTVAKWINSNEVVRKFWAKKVQDTEWGREFLVLKGFLRRGEPKNVLLPEIMGYFADPNDKVGLRLSTTALNFKTFNMDAYEKMVATALELNPNGLTLAPIAALKPNNLPAKPPLSTSSISPELRKSVNLAKSPEHSRTNKRRRVEETPVDETPAAKSTRQPTSAGSERGRRVSRGNVNYRIAPMSEFDVDEGGKGGEVIDLRDEVEDEEAEDEADEEESEDEGEMVID